MDPGEFYAADRFSSRPHDGVTRFPAASCVRNSVQVDLQQVNSLTSDLRRVVDLVDQIMKGFLLTATGSQPETWACYRGPPTSSVALNQILAFICEFVCPPRSYRSVT